MFTDTDLARHKMRPEKGDANKPGLPELIRAIIRLDLPNLSTRSMESHIYTPHARQRNVRVASVATIRILLVTFAELKSILSSICKCNKLKSFYESRKLLSQKVLPETFAAFEYCREVLRLRGSTDSPIASKLAQTAYAVADYIEHLKTCVDIAAEYHELRYETIAEITKFAERPSFKPENIAPLLFSIEVTLPMRLDMFAARAAAFPDGVERLTSLAHSATSLARARIESVSPKLGDTCIPCRPLNKPESPRRPSIKVLRGVRVRQALSSPHQRIPSFSEPLAQPAPPPPDEANKENPASDAVLAKNRRSRLRPPSKVENRRVVQTPLSPLREVPQPRTRSSRIFRPTQISTRPSTLSLRTPRQHTADLSHYMPSMSDVSMSGMSGMSSFDCTLEETPLAHKSTRPSPNGTSQQLLIPRRRPHGVRV